MTQVLHYRIRDLVPYINWLYFFHAWHMPSRYASIAALHQCPACRNGWLASLPKAERNQGREALSLYDEAMQMLCDMDILGVMCHAAVGIFPAHSDNDSIIIHRDAADGGSMVLPLLRQQVPGSDGYCLCLSDFVRSDCDTVGVFATSVDDILEQAHADDDYRHLLCQTLADRLAEATAEKMHQEVRTRIWGYAPDEHLSISELHGECFHGIRPAVGYPSLPDQSINFLLMSLVDMQGIGIRLTESGAMIPHASTSGLMLAHTKAHHFSVGHIGEDQLADYAQRRGMPVERMRRFLAANI